MSRHLYFVLLSPGPALCFAASAMLNSQMFGCGCYFVGERYGSV